MNVLALFGIIITLIILIVYMSLCIEVGKTAKRLNRSLEGWAILAIITTPLIAGIMLYCLGESFNDQNPYTD